MNLEIMLLEFLKTILKTILIIITISLLYIYRYLWLNPGARGEHLTIQLSWLAP